MLQIITTEEHPFWVEGYGFVPAGELAEGDCVENAGGEILRISKAETEYLAEPVTVYNFEVEDWHTYYVSEEEIFVHNMCATNVSINAEKPKGWHVGLKPMLLRHEYLQDGYQR